MYSEHKLYCHDLGVWLSDGVWIRWLDLLHSTCNYKWYSNIGYLHTLQITRTLYVLSIFPAWNIRLHLLQDDWMQTDKERGQMLCI
jgi:hypothetical protein